VVEQKYYLIMNPTCRSGRGKKTFRKILSIFESKGLTFDYKLTQGYEDATFIAAEAIKNGWNNIIAVGGDGTICEVLNGFFIEPDISRKAKLGVIHVGTSPDFNRYHNIPVNFEKAIDTIIKGESSLIDLGKIAYKDNNNEDIVRYFGSNVNVGMGPLIAGKANARHRKYLGDFLGTLCATLGSLLRFKPTELEVSVDKQKISFENLINITVGKDPYLASGMRVFHDISHDDGKLYILTIQNTSMFSLLANVPNLYIGDFLNYKGAKLKYAQEVVIEHNSKYPMIEFDGDVKGYLPAKIVVMPKALEVIVG